MPDLTPLLADASSNLLAARYQMAFTLGFHIILACFGVAFPAMMLIAEYRGRKHDDAEALRLAERWSKVVAVLFAVGAVSGTVLSFELGLLWPEMMDRFGDAFGVAFAIEGIFFFLEAIFIAIYIYGWKRLPGWAHFWSGIPIVISGVGGAAAVIAANSWMNTPQGFELGADGRVSDVNVADVLLNPSFWHEFPHMWLAAYMVTGFLVASVYAVGMMRGRRDRYHRLGFLIPFTVAAIATPIQLFVGDMAARDVADDQKSKFAALECVYETKDHQPENVFGICESDDIKYEIAIPDLDSFLVGWSVDTVVTGLDDIPDDEKPPALTLIHWAFDVMVGIGTALLLLAAWFAIVWWRRRSLPESIWFLRAAAIAGAAAIVAMESGWIVTEVGRQPWIVRGFMRTEEAVTGAQGLWWVFGLTMTIYATLAVVAAFILRAFARRWREAEGEPEVPYGPRPDRKAPTGGAAA
ncbi:MAG TPA: cytochrome ubiquinol oxidase subunit I [Solirubrobacterales bacterium]|nr:cytochrome ubiquinol oxidase subunit I [Solirubrobacterales bacterium]